MGDRNPWAVENIEAFSFYCCPECDFKSKDGDHFERHALESHNKSKAFFIMTNDKKSENNEKSECMEVKTESKFQDKTEEGSEDFFASENRVKEESMSESDGEDFVRLNDDEAQKLIHGPDYTTQEDLDKFDDQKLEEIKTFDGDNYENITDAAEASDGKTFEIINKELENFIDHDVEKTKILNSEIFDNVAEHKMSDKDNVANEAMIFSEDKCNIIEEKKNKDNVIEENSYVEDTLKAINESKQDIDSKSYVVDTPKCPICEKEIIGKNWRELMKVHMKYIHKVNIKKELTMKFKCDICDCTYATKQNLHNHIKAKHMKIKAFKCKDCSKNFLTKRSMESHHKRVHLFIKPYKRYTCHDCGISFEQNINESKQDIDSKSCDVDILKCPICEKEITGKNCRENMKVHHEK